MITSLRSASIAHPTRHLRDEQPSTYAHPAYSPLGRGNGIDRGVARSHPAASVAAPGRLLRQRALKLGCFAKPPLFAKDSPMENVLLAPWSGPHGGLPPFDHVSAPQLDRALSQGMELAHAQIEAIAQQKDSPTFANTIVALEKAGRALDRARRMLDTYTSSLNDAAMQELESRVRPLLAAFDDEFVQNAPLFARIQAVHHSEEKATLDAEQQRLVDEVHRGFVRSGAALSPADKARLKEINQQLATLYTQFGQNLLKDESERFLLLTDPSDLAGLPQSLCEAACAAATARGHAHGWLLSNTRSSIEPFLTYATRGDLREKAWRMYVERGEHDGPNDNRPIITQVLSLRRARARLLGYASHAHWATDDGMAKTPQAAMQLMMKVWKAAAARAREEVRDMQKMADAEAVHKSLQPWDYRFYAEKVRHAKFDFDGEAVRPYLQLNNIRDAMFWSAKTLYGLEFSAMSDVPTFHPDVEVYQVMRQGELAGLWYFDPYARDGKHSGAWMSEYRSQERIDAPVAPIVSNNANFVRGAAGAPVLISWDDAVTMFHEFGHALHGLCSQVHYPSLSGTRVSRDFVEFPSQLNEHWLDTPEILHNFAKHCDTGEPLNQQLMQKMHAAKTFNQGFHTVEYLAAAIYDLKIHSIDSDAPIDPIGFEKQVMSEIDCPKEIVMRHRPTQFAHIFSGDGYSAGYYSYIWADTLTADAAEAFSEAGSFFDAVTAKRYFDTVLSVGNAVAPEQAFRAFRGRDVDTGALMRDRGLAS